MLDASRPEGDGLLGKIWRLLRCNRQEKVPEAPDWYEKGMEEPEFEDELEWSDGEEVWEPPGDEKVWERQDSDEFIEEPGFRVGELEKSGIVEGSDYQTREDGEVLSGQHIYNINITYVLTYIHSY